MKNLAYALITFGLIVGSLTAVTAYVPSLSGIGGAPVTLNADAGRSPDDAAQPLVSPAASEEPILLTDTLAATLAAAGVRRVRVKEFSFGRWDHGWLFLLALGAMLAGGLILRREERQKIAALLGREADETETPGYALEAARHGVDALLGELVGQRHEEQMHHITSRLDVIQQTHLAAFVDARPELVGRYGIAGYARVMDAFAAAERTLNRAWSAAADGVLPASIEALQIGMAHLEETQRRLAEQ